VLATVSRNVTAPPRTRCVMPVIEPGWDIVSCRCRCRLRRARSPASRPFFLVLSFVFPGRRVAAVVPAVAMAVASTRTCTHPSTYPHAHAPAHAHVFAWEGKKPNPFSFCSSTELSSPAFRRGEPRRRLPWCRSARWCERQVIHELARPFSCSHTQTIAGCGHPSRAAEPLYVCPLWTSRTHTRSPPVLALVLQSTHTRSRTP
jgi:hypothetical protein